MRLNNLWIFIQLPQSLIKNLCFFIAYEDSEMKEVCSRNFIKIFAIFENRLNAVFQKNTKFLKRGRQGRFSSLIITGLFVLWT